MSHTWTLTKMRLRLALRNRAFFFFSLFMPLLFLVGGISLFARGASAWIGYILGAILTFTVMGSFWGLSAQLVTFREQGILRRFRLAPIGAGPLLASGILANYIMVLPTVVIEILVCREIFHMRSFGNLWGIFLLITFGSAAFSAFGLIIASVTNTMQETQILNNLIWMGFILFSGATIPLTQFPGWIQRLSLFLPATYLATGLEAAATSMAGWSEIVTDCVALAIGMWAAFEVSRQLFRWEPEARVPSRAKLWVLAALVPFLVFGAWENVTGARLQRARFNFQALGGELIQQHGAESH
jgi:ABC-2 type transport system permease protein